MNKNLPYSRLLEPLLLKFTCISMLVVLSGTYLSAQVNVVLQSTSPLCGGFSTGIITALPSGGTSPYSFLWSNGDTTQTISNLPTGSYSVTVTDDQETTATASTTLMGPPPLTATINVLTCDLPGTLNVIASGGVPTYDFEWSNGDTTATITNLSAGEYCVTIFDQNACGFVNCQSVGPLLEVTVETSPAGCGSSNGGTATVNISGGVPPLEILWNAGATTPSIENLPPGTYSVTVTSVNGCSAQASGTVGNNAGSFDTELEVSNPTCAGFDDGEITANPTGGEAPYSYAWTSGDTTQTTSNLAPNIYSVTVTDAFGCTSTNSTVLANQSDINVTLTGVNPNCAGASNGSISAFPNGGVEPYNYVWNNGDTTQMSSNLMAGIYTVTVSDDLGCTDSASTTLTAPAAFTVSTTSMNASECGANDGSVSASPAGGGSPPFSYLWSNGAMNNVVNGIAAGTYTVTVTSVQGCSATGSATVEQPTDLEVEISGSSLICPNTTSGTLTANVNLGTTPYTYDWDNGDSTQTINNLAAGNYSVTVTSSEGCTGTASAVITTGPAINLELIPQNLTCFGNNTGQIVANASGGTPPLTYLWNNGSTSSNISNLAAGTYFVTVTDGNGCTVTETSTIFQPSELNIVFDTNGSCGANGWASAEVSGGTATYNYLWSNGQTTPSIFGLAPGNFSITVTDANGCTEIQTANVPAFPLVELEVTSTNTTCNGTSDGTVTAEVNNGTAPFDFQWSNGSTSSSQTGLSPGNYSVTVTDANECQAFGSAFIALGAGLNVEIDAPTYVCDGTTVLATAEANGGTPNYTYLWSNGETTQTISGLSAGNLSVTVSDPAGCSGSAMVLLLPGGMFEVTEDITPVDCFGEATGSISLDVVGGAPPLNFLWSNGANTPGIQNLPAGNYALTVSDQTECEQLFDFEVMEPAELILDIDTENGTCGNLGAASANVEGGQPNYDFLWSNGSTSPSLENLPAGTYSLTVTDANQCTTSSMTSLEVTPSPTCEITLAQVISTIDGNDGQLTAEVTGGNAPFTFLWSDGQTTPTATNLASGNYSVTVTDADGCETTCDFTLLNPGILGDFAWNDANMDGIQNTDETGVENVSVTLTGTDDYGNMVTDNAITAADGTYEFLVQPGIYQLMVGLPNDFILTNENIGNDDALDSDVNPFTNTTPDYAIGEGEENFTIDIGLFESLCDNVTAPGSICCDQTLCGPGTVPAPIIETSPATGGIGTLEYAWMYSTVPGPFDPSTWLAIPSATGPNFTPGPLAETTYFVRRVRREGCNVFLDSDQVTITLDDSAIAEINGPNTACAGDSVDFSATDSGPEATYTWTFLEGNPTTANEQNVNGVTWDSFGEKTVALAVENNGCISYDTLLVEISNSPTLCGNDFVIDAELIAPSTVRVSWDYSTPDTSGLNFQVIWAAVQPDFEIIGEPELIEQNDTEWYFEKQHDNPVLGSNFYRAVLTNDLGETIFSNTVEVIVSRREGNLVEIYPNPFSEIIALDIIDRHGSRITLDIYDSLGREVRFFEVPEVGEYFEMPTDYLPSGTYFIFVRYDGSPQKIFKMIK